MTKRRMARELAVQFLYEADGGIDSTEFRLNAFFMNFASESLIYNGFISSACELYTKKESLEIFDFFKDIAAGTLNNLDKIDFLIQKVSKNWSIDRMSRIDRNILRQSMFEILFHSEIPKNVTINEAIEIAKKFGNADSPFFINGVLDAAVQNINL